MAQPPPQIIVPQEQQIVATNESQKGSAPLTAFEIVMIIVAIIGIIVVLWLIFKKNKNNNEIRNQNADNAARDAQLAKEKAERDAQLAKEKAERDAQLAKEKAERDRLENERREREAYERAAEDRARRDREQAAEDKARRDRERAAEDRARRDRERAAEDRARRDREARERAAPPAPLPLSPPPPKSEVFFINSPIQSAQSIDYACSKFDAKAATLAQVQDAWNNGIELCADVGMKESEGSNTVVFRRAIQNQIGTGCGTGNSGLNVITQANNPRAACYGVRPQPGSTAPDGTTVFTWNLQQWSRYPTSQKDFGATCRIKDKADLESRTIPNFAKTFGLDTSVEGRKTFIPKCIQEGGCYTFGDMGAPSICFRPSA